MVPTWQDSELSSRLSRRQSKGTRLTASSRAFTPRVPYCTLQEEGNREFSHGYDSNRDRMLNFRFGLMRFEDRAESCVDGMDAATSGHGDDPRMKRTKSCE